MAKKKRGQIICCAVYNKKTIIYNDKLVMTILVQRETDLTLKKEGMSVRMREERQKEKCANEKKRDAKKSFENRLLKVKDEW